MNPLIVNATPRCGELAQAGGLAGMYKGKHMQHVPVKVNGMKLPILGGGFAEVGQPPVLGKVGAQEPLYWAVTKKNESPGTRQLQFRHDLMDACTPGSRSWGRLQ